MTQIIVLEAPVQCVKTDITFRTSSVMNAAITVSNVLAALNARNVFLENTENFVSLIAHRAAGVLLVVKTLAFVLKAVKMVIQWLVDTARIVRETVPRVLL